MNFYIKWKDKYHGINKVEKWEKISKSKAKAMIDREAKRTGVTDYALDWSLLLVNWVTKINTPKFIISTNKDD